MQLNKLSPLAVAILATVLSACGGGGEDAPPPAAPAPAPVIKVSALALNSATPRAIADTLLQFDGGVCSGGTGTVTSSWDYGDGTGATTLSTHTYTDTTEGVKTVKVTCTDSVGATKFTTLNVNVLNVAMKGFLGKTWTTYSSIESNVSPYPVAGIADSGDVYGVWLRRNIANTMEVAAGTTNFGSATWTTPTVLPTAGSQSPFDDSVKGGSTAAIDLAVSPNGRVMAAWLAGSSIWYATKNGLGGAWSAPTEIVGETVKTDASASIKVVVNDAGNAAIGYCKSDTDARVITYSGATQTHQPSEKISKLCGTAEVIVTATQQRYRAFDIAIDNANTASSTVYAVGVDDGTIDSTKSAVKIKSYTISGGWTTAASVSDELTAAKAPTSLSFARSPNGNYAAIVWDQINSINTNSNVHANFYSSGAWGAATPVQTNYITKKYSRPLIAVNDKGNAFLLMRLVDEWGNSQTEVSTYNAASPGWTSPYQIIAAGHHATNIAIDNWGTGLVTRANDFYSQAGTFSKAGEWSGFKNVSPQYPYGMQSTFHYQTMRALPDGRAILVTSVYDDITPITDTTKPVSSGYTILK